MRDFLEAMDGIIDQSQRRLDSNRELTQQGEQAEQDLLGFDIRPFSPLDEYVLSPAIDAIWGETPEVIKETIQSSIDSLIWSSARCCAA